MAGLQLALNLLRVSLVASATNNVLTILKKSLTVQLQVEGTKYKMREYLKVVLAPAFKLAGTAAGTTAATIGYDAPSVEGATILLLGVAFDLGHMFVRKQINKRR